MKDATLVNRDELDAGKREFPLTRYFLITGLIVMGGATALTTWLTVAEVREELTTNAAEYAREIVDNLFHQIEEEFLQPLAATGGSYSFEDKEQVAALREVVERSIHGHNVRKLYFFDPDGIILFSTQAEHVGFPIPPDNSHFMEALGGEVSWVLKRRNDPLDISGSRTGEQLLETYVPVRSRFSESQEVGGVIEIYQGVTELNRDLRKSAQRIITVALCGLGALLVVSTYFVRRASRVIHQRRVQLLESNRALQELSRNLETLVDKRTRQLIEKQKLASLGQLSAGLAHEINTPLGTIAACSEGSLARLRELPEGVSGPLADVSEYLELIHVEAFHCKEILRSLLDYSRQSRVAESVELDLNQLVEQTLTLLRVNKEYGSLPVDTSLFAESATLRGDPVQVRQVIFNLIENAIHATRGVEEPRISLRTRSEKDQVVFECQDNGGGIPPEVREKIFDPFFTTKATREGIGLGLALSFNIIQRHGGVLELVRTESPLGPESGTLFRFTLPRQTNQPLGQETV